MPPSSQPQQRQINAAAKHGFTADFPSSDGKATAFLSGGNPNDGGILNDKVKPLVPNTPAMAEAKVSAGRSCAEGEEIESEHARLERLGQGRPARFKSFGS